MTVRVAGEPRLAALDAGNSVLINAQSFGIGAGGPTLTLEGARDWGWRLRTTASDRINTVFRLPRQKRNVKVDIDVLWANTATTTGGVVFQGYWGDHTVGSGVDTVATLAPVTVPADPYTNSLKRTRIASQLDLGANMMPMLMLQRTGNDAADTLANDITVFGVLITETPAYGGVLSHDAKWCWFNEPRLLAHPSATMLYSAFVDSQGSVGVASLNTSTLAVTQSILHQWLEADDHDTPGMAILANGKVAAFYCTHSIVDDPIRFRVTTAAHDVSAWDAEQTITLPAGGQPCYPKPALIGTRLYVFFRNTTNADYIYSDDSGATWSAPASLFTWSSGWRGYVNMVVNGTRVDFTCNDDNPNVSSNCNLYHCYLSGGNLYKTDGTLIGALGTTVGPAQMTKVYDYTSRGDAWGWDLQLDGTGKPRAVFATFPGASIASASDTDHRAQYARWTGSAWVVSEIPVSLGPTITDRSSEYRYSGGLALLSSDTSVVYLSRKVNDQWEIERWQTPDNGATWAAQAVTTRSAEKQLRPTTPEGHFAGCPEVAWEAGWMATYNHYGTRLVYRPA